MRPSSLTPLLLPLLVLPACGPSRRDAGPPPPAGCPAGMASVAAPDHPSFCLDRTEVTLSAYLECVGRAQCTARAEASGCNRDDLVTQQHPANCVDASQADDYCKALKKRLPTADEWRRAAEQLGSSLDACTSRADPQAKTCPVAADEPRVTGLGGNVSEWTATPAPEPDTRRVMGPSYQASRPAPEDGVSLPRTTRAPTVGFRCAR